MLSHACMRARTRRYRTTGVSLNVALEYSNKNPDSKRPDISRNLVCCGDRAHTHTRTVCLSRRTLAVMVARTLSHRGTVGTLLHLTV